MSIPTDIPKLMLKFTLPACLEFNITIWKVTSKRDPLAKPKCKNSAYLTLFDSYTFNPLHERPIFCDNASVLISIALPVQTAYLFWKSDFPYEKATSVCLTYQTTAIGYIRQYAPSYNWLPLTNYFKDGLIDRDFNVDMSRMLLISQRRHGIRNISEVFKDFATYVFDKNMLYSYSAGSVLHRVWSITGNIYYIPQFQLGNFSCTTHNGNSNKHPTLEIFVHPLAHFDVIWQILPYVIGPPIKCNKTVSSRLYDSSIGDLTLLLTASIADDAHILYIVLPCPGDHCENTVKTISDSKGNTCTMTSHSRNTQQRLLIEKSDHDTGFIAISNFSIRINGLTHMPCYYGGLFIYELEPLTLVAKICTPWVAEAWYYAVKRVDGTNGIWFNTRPIMFVIKSYGVKFSVHVEGYATTSQCSGVVNSAFRDIASKIKVSQSGEIMWNPPHRRAVGHAHGCFQLSHILTDGMYLTAEQSIQLLIYASDDTFGNVANHTIEATVNAKIETWLNFEIVRSAYQNATAAFTANEMSKGKRSCRIFEAELGLLDANPFTCNESYVVSLLPGRRSYSVGFSEQCLVLGINPVFTMDYISAPMHSCLKPVEMKRRVRQFYPFMSLQHNAVSLSSLICGSLHDFYPNPEKALLTFIIFNKPSFKSVCCVLDLDINVYKKHLHVLRAIAKLEQDTFHTGFMLTSDRFRPHGKFTNKTFTDRMYYQHIIKSDVQEMFYEERISALWGKYFFLCPIRYFWSCSSRRFCNMPGNVSMMHENSSVNVRVTGRPWSVNSLTTDNAVLTIQHSNSDDAFYRRINISFRYREWHAAAAPPIIFQFPLNDSNWGATQLSNWKLEYSYCFRAFGICYDFYGSNISSWLEGEELCRSEGKFLLSTPTNYGWEIITTLFARDPYVINLVAT